MNNIIEIVGEYITVGQFIKKIGFISTGGMSKPFLEMNNVLINNKKAIGRNSKIYLNDVVWINNKVYKIVSKEK